MLKSKINSSAFFTARTSFSLRAVAAQKYLNFNMEFQMQTNWCWATTAVCTSKFYNRNSPWTICRLVNDQLGQTSCCDNGSGYNCNQPYYLYHALKRTLNFEDWTQNPISFDEVKDFIDRGRPIGVGITWRAGGAGHFLIIDGYDENNGNPRLSIRDSWFQSGMHDFFPFRNNYQQRGFWSETYFTRP